MFRSLLLDLVKSTTDNGVGKIVSVLKFNQILFSLNLSDMHNNKSQKLAMDRKDLQDKKSMPSVNFFFKELLHYNSISTFVLNKCRRFR